MANNEAKSPSMKTKEELVQDQVSSGMAAPVETASDPMQEKLKGTIKQYEDLVNKKDEPRDWRQNLPDLLSAAHNIINYGQGSQLPMLKTDYTTNELKQNESTKDSNLNRLSKLQDMYRKYQEGQNKDSLTPYQQAQLDNAEKDRKLKKELAEAKPKEISFAEKEQAKADVKERMQVNKENRQAKKEAKDVITGIDEQIANVKKARQLMTKAADSKNVADTGPIDQFIAKTTDKGQELEQAMNSVSLDKMVKMFAGMSKAIDSDAERAFFQSAQPAMGKYPTVNKKILDDMLINLESLKTKNKTFMNSINDKGEMIEQDSTPTEDKPSIDPKIKNYADENDLDYEKAEKILRSRGYNG
jgi:hypothetical protein